MSRFAFIPLAVGIVLTVAFLAFAGGFVVDVFQMGQDASLANDIKTVASAIHDYQMFNGAANLPGNPRILALGEGQNSTPFGQVAVSEGNSIIVELTGKQFTVIGTSSIGNVLTFNSEVGSISTRN